MSSAPAQTDLLRIDDQLTSDERLVRDTVREFTADRIEPHIADWFEAGTVPRDLMPELGKLGLLGMHLTGYGCAGMGAVAYGVACRELEAADSGLRSTVSVQGSLAMFPIWKYGSDEQKEEWLPKMASGEAVGCFGLTEPDHGSDPGGMSTRARRAGSDWLLSGSKMWITNGSIANIAVVWASTDEGVRGFLVPRGTPGFTTNDMHKKMALRASITSELHFDDVRLPEDAMLPGVQGLKGPLSCLSEARYGILWGVTGAARSCFDAAVAYAGSREQFGKPIAGFQLTQGKLAWMASDLGRGQVAAVAPGAAEGGRAFAAGTGFSGEDEQRPDGDRHRPAGADDPGGQRGDPGVSGHPARQQPGGRADLRGHRGDPHAGHRAGHHRNLGLPLTGWASRAQGGVQRGLGLGALRSREIVGTLLGGATAPSG